MATRIAPRARPVVALLTAAVLLPVTAALGTGAIAATTAAGAAGAATGAAAPVTLEATLRPSGDPNGRGAATVRLDKSRKRVCARLEWRRIRTPDAAHIHSRSDGSIKIDLTRAADGRGCTRNVPRREIADVLEHPRRYYVNVHNSKYPAGAIQGNLHR